MATKKTAKYEMGDEFLNAKYIPQLSLEDVKFYLDDIRLSSFDCKCRRQVSQVVI